MAVPVLVEITVADATFNAVSTAFTESYARVALSASSAECAVVGASCITVSACDICTQRSTVLTVIVCRTHFAVCTFQTSTASTADPRACIALLAANGTNFYVISTTAVANSNKLAV